jgi:hypothetical protein
MTKLRIKMVHFLKKNKRTTACGRDAKVTQRDTRLIDRVSCRTCLRAIEARRRMCEEYFSSRDEEI